VSGLPPTAGMRSGIDREVRTPDPYQHQVRRIHATLTARTTVPGMAKALTLQFEPHPPTSLWHPNSRRPSGGAAPVGRPDQVSVGSLLDSRTSGRT
jgi:hypothetical protein